MKLLSKTLLLSGLMLAASNARADQSGVSITNELLRGELSAIETYKQAVDKFGNTASGPALKQFQSEHEDAAAKLRDQVVRLGGTPDKSSGAWGVWAKSVEGTGKTFGETAALKVLKEGEEHGIKEYKELLENKNAPSELKDEVRTGLLPAQQKHIGTLDDLMNRKG